MPESLSSVLIHVIFSTKDRAPLLDADMRPKLYAYLASTTRDCGCECYRVGGVSAIPQKI